MSEPGTAMREERRFVTALFADLAGSTALAERLEPEELKLVVGDAIARIVGRAVVSGRGGRCSASTCPGARGRWSGALDR
ncbi:MAG: hypothetical protein ACRDG8_03820 [Actinomycetota bacterium]